MKVNLLPVTGLKDFGGWRALRAFRLVLVHWSRSDRPDAQGFPFPQTGWQQSVHCWCAGQIQACNHPAAMKTRRLNASTLTDGWFSGGRHPR